MSQREDEHEDDDLDDESDDESGAESEEDDEGDEEESQTNVRARPRAVPRPNTVMGFFGSVPTMTTHWGIKRKTSYGGWEKLSHPSPDGAVTLQEWPLSELSEETVRQRWGAGMFRVQWFGVTPNGGRRFLTQGRVVTFNERPAPAPPPAPSPLPSGLPSEMASMMALLEMVDRRTNAQVGQLASLAQVLGGRPQQGALDATTLQLLFERQANATATAMRDALAPLSQGLADVQRRLADLEGGDEDEDTTGAVASAAAAAGVNYKRGMSVSDVLGSIVMQHPKEAIEVLRGIPTIVSAVAGAVTAANQASARRAVARPRVVDAETPAMPAAPPSPPPPSGPGMNAAAAARASEAATGPGLNSAAVTHAS